jgi:hypothetical protein
MSATASGYPKTWIWYWHGACIYKTCDNLLTNNSIDYVPLN